MQLLFPSLAPQQRVDVRSITRDLALFEQEVLVPDVKRCELARKVRKGDEQESNGRGHQRDPTKPRRIPCALHPLRYPKEQNDRYRHADHTTPQGEGPS